MFCDANQSWNPIVTKISAAGKAGGGKAGGDKAGGETQKPMVRQAYEAMREKIIRLQFLPGQYLNEAAICDALGLGRTPVHQALQLLQVEGLVEILPRKGIIVQPDGLSEILKILESRIVIEPELARKAAENSAAGTFEPKELDALVSLAEEPDETVDPPDIDAFISNDRAFHRNVAQMSENAILGEFATSLHDRCCRFWYLNLWQTINVDVSKEKHVAIARAIARGKSDLAADAMRDHIANLVKRLESLPPNAFGGLLAGPGRP